MEISVIIPIYKGKQYIEFWINRIQENINKFPLKERVKSELIFINDYPDELLPDIKINNEFLEVRVINSTTNQGIHASRVCGIKNSKGKFIVLLDQDDEISEMYLYSQYKKIENNDLIVCNGYITKYCVNGKKAIYKNSEMYNLVKKYENFKKKNCICSPGQVMIRKESIPKEWMNNIMKKNGADDYFLWILLHSMNKSFIANQEFHYMHIGHEQNASSDLKSMKSSLKEMIEILECKELIPQKDIKEIKENVILKNDSYWKYMDTILLYDKWMYLKNRGLSIAKYLVKRNYKKVIIYGMGYLGNRLYDELEKSEVKVIAALDMVAERIQYDIPVVTFEEELAQQYINDTDVIIITVGSDQNKIEAKIQNKYKVSVLLLNEIILEAIREDIEKE